MLKTYTTVQGDMWDSIAYKCYGDESGINVRYTALEAVEGKKKKMPVEHNERIDAAEVNSVRPYLEF